LHVCFPVNKYVGHVCLLLSVCMHLCACVGTKVSEREERIGGGERDGGERDSNRLTKLQMCVDTHMCVEATAHVCKQGCTRLRVTGSARAGLWGFQCLRLTPSSPRGTLTPSPGLPGGAGAEPPRHQHLPHAAGVAAARRQQGRQRAAPGAALPLDQAPGAPGRGRADMAPRPRQRATASRAAGFRARPSHRTRCAAALQPAA
jgi:hypothetical protein